LGGFKRNHAGGDDMKNVADATLFGLIHDFFKIYLPTQRGCSQHTIRSYQTAVETFLDFIKSENRIGLSQITFKMINAEILSAFLDSIEQNGSSVSTRNHRLTSIRTFFDYAAKINPSTVIYLKEISKVPKKNIVKSDVVEYMSEPAVKAMLESADPLTKKGLRDRFLLMLMYDSAARVQEILNLRLCDIKQDKTVTVSLFGKGSKIRSVPLMKQTLDYYECYKQYFHPNENKYSEKYLFYTVMHGQQHTMYDSTVRRIVYAYRDAARKLCPDVPANVHPHMFRHSRAMHLYQHGMDLSLLSQWLGHSQIETTLIYAHADTEQKRKAIETATTGNNPLRKNLNAERYIITDDETLKRLYGLK
jgi:site-specific recombinase XerD